MYPQAAEIRGEFYPSKNENIYKHVEVKMAQQKTKYKRILNQTGVNGEQTGCAFILQFQQVNLICV
jgi:hypothetical protein